MNRSIVALDCKTATMNIREEVKRETAKYVLYSSPHLKATIKNEGHIGNEKFVVPSSPICLVNGFVKMTVFRVYQVQ